MSSNARLLCLLRLQSRTARVPGVCKGVSFCGREEANARWIREEMGPACALLVGFVPQHSAVCISFCCNTMTFWFRTCHQLPAFFSPLWVSVKPHSFLLCRASVLSSWGFLGWVFVVVVFLIFDFFYCHL